jgi:hypothetical protein
MSDTDTGAYGSGLGTFGGGGADVPPPPVSLAPPPPAQAPPDPAVPVATPAAAPSAPGGGFGSMLGTFSGPHYTPPDPQAAALDQTADTLQQRIARANQIATNPLAAFFNPEGVQKARDFVPAATEALQKIKQQKADMQANRTQAQTLGLDPGEVPDEASQADRVEAAVNGALKGDLKKFQGLANVDPARAAAIQDQVHEVVSGHLANAQKAYDKLSNMHNEGEYQAAVQSLRNDGTLTDLESLGTKVPKSFDQFNASKATEGKALREAGIAAQNLRSKLEERADGTPMEKKEAETYAGYLTTESGAPLSNITWERINGQRVATANGMADIRDLGKKFNFASADQRKAMHEDTKAAVEDKEMEKFRNFNRTRSLAVTDAKGNYIPPEGVVDPKNPGRRIFMNDNPNVQQGVAEGLASMLRGGTGGATSGLLNIETSKRGYVQAVLDKIMTNYGGAINTLTGNQVKPYLTQLTQEQQRAVMDGLQQYSGKSIADRLAPIAKRAGELGLGPDALGLGKNEIAGVEDAIEAGRQSTINRFTPRQRATSGGDGGIYLDHPPPVLVTQPPLPQGSVPPVPPPVQPQTQQPGAAAPMQQPVPPTVPGGPGGTPPSPANNQPLQSGGGQPPVQPTPGGPAPVQPTPVTVAGQQVNVALPPGASPNLVPAFQRIESGNEKSPWTAGTKNSSASGAFQFINSTWNEDKPAGAPARAADATPQQQAEALSTRLQKNAAALTGAGFPVNDTNLYVAHNLGATGAAKLLQANPNADARSIVGETAAKNNPMFFKGRPTVAMVLQRYQDQMKPADPDTPQPKPGAGGAAETPGLMTRISRMLSQGIPGSGADKDAAVRDVGTSAAEHAPAIGGTLGAIGGSVAGPAGTIAGGGVGSGAGQALKDYIQGNPQSPAKIAEQTALGGVLGVNSVARPFVSAGARVLGAGGVEAGAEAAKGGDAGDIIDAAGKGAGEAAGGELFGRALGMAGHKIFSLFTPDAQKAVRSAAADLHEANETLKTEQPTLPSATGASSPNPKYEAAQEAKDKAETTIKEMMPNAKPDEVAYAHKVTADAVPTQEAQVSRPGALEKERVGAGYQQLESEIGKAGVGAPKATPKLPDGPRAAVENKQVSAAHSELADHVEMAITAPAANWQEKWNQLKDARSQLLQAERDALSSTAPGKTKTAADMRTLADTVRAQQAKAAEYVFGKQDGEAFMGRLKVLDTRYRNLMDATNSGDLAKAATLKGEAGRQADQKFRAFAHDDPVALGAWNAMRKGGSNVENDVRTLVGAENLPVIGKVVTWAKMASRLREWSQERAAGSPVKFADLVKTPGFFDTDKPIRDLTGSIGARAATQ